MYKTIIEKLPEDHFGKITKEAISDLIKGKCYGVYGLPGYGMDFFARHIVYLINKTYPEISVIHLNLQFENDKVHVLQQRLSQLLNKKNFDEMDIVEYLKTKKILIVLGETYTYKYPKLFKQLYTLWSMNQKHFAVLTVANYTLFKHKLKYMENGKLVFSSTRIIPNFDKDGVQRIIEINNSEHNWNVPINMTDRIFELTGGNPALVRALSVAIYEEGEEVLDHLPKLINHQPLGFRLSELANLIPKLSIDEQFHLGLINQNGRIFCGLLKEYLRKDMSNKINSRLNLTSTEEKLLQIFSDNRGKIINKDQLSIILNQTIENYSEWAIYKAIQRFRNKIKNNGYRIITMKGKGWVLDF